MPTSAADRSSSTPPNDAFTRFSRLVEWPMAVLALAVVPALVLEQRASSDGLTMAALVGNWVIWIGFCGEYLVKLYLAPQRVAFVRAAWFDLVIIVLSPPFLCPIRSRPREASAPCACCACCG